MIIEYNVGCTKVYRDSSKFTLTQYKLYLNSFSLHAVCCSDIENASSLNWATNNSDVLHFFMQKKAYLYRNLAIEE